METLEYLHDEPGLGMRCYRILSGEYMNHVRLKFRTTVRRRGKTFVYWN
ncbi:MAG TPA: hypothetical protein VIN36_10435 [Thiobacillus sp.]